MRYFSHVLIAWKLPTNLVTKGLLDVTQHRPVIFAHMFANLMHRILVLLLAVFLTASMELSVVQTSIIHAKMSGMDQSMGDQAMSEGMSMPGPAKCPDCDKSGLSKGMPGCIAPACTAVAAIPSPEGFLRVSRLESLRFGPALHPALNGHESVPDPYPPRTSDIV